MHRITLVLFLVFLFNLIFIQIAHSLPVDWHGTIGVDSTRIGYFRKLERADQSATSEQGGNQEVNLADGNHDNASFQSYILKLSPEILINDSASFKGEITTGYGRGGRFGDSSIQSKEANLGNALYHYNTSRPDDNKLTLSKFYLELYANTATYQLGRHSFHWGLGAVFNNGDNIWDRHSYTRDGITMKVKMDNFRITPYWAKISSEGSLTRATNAKEYGFSFLYDNSEQDLKIGFLYGKKKNGPQNSSISGGSGPLKMTSVKLYDLFFQKAFGDYKFMVEVPIFGGNLGYVYNQNNTANYKAKAILFQSTYKLNDNYKLGLDAGTVNGDRGEAGSYEAMYLNPNYQIANLLFRYNLRAVSDPTGKSIYDSYITNAKFLKIHGSYHSSQWLWKAAFIYAIAEEVAKGGGDMAYNHSTNTTFESNFAQKDDLGFEIDLSCEYQWNKEITFGVNGGYHFAGDYFAYNNTATPNTVKDSYVIQMRASADF